MIYFPFIIVQIKQEQNKDGGAAGAVASSSSNADNVQQQQQQQPTTTQSTDHQVLITEALQVGDTNTGRIFSYKAKAPAAPNFHQNPLRVVYSVKTPMSTKSATRYIPQSPERILDAPDIINDYCN